MRDGTAQAKGGPDIARLAALIGDPARANMLTALMAGRALTAGELAREAGVTPQTASGHIARLEEGGLVAIVRQGRHRYATLAGPEVAEALEALMGLAAGQGHLRSRPGPRDPALREARVCYNHLAGDRGLQMYDALVAAGRLSDEGPVLTAEGAEFVRGLGIDLDALRRGRAPLCRHCLDWSGRRPHLAGSLGRALFETILARGWARREAESRAVRFSPEGARVFDGLFPPADRCR